jgi:hypothetical protein
MPAADHYSRPQVRTFYLLNAMPAADHYSRPQVRTFYLLSAMLSLLSFRRRGSPFDNCR